MVDQIFTTSMNFQNLRNLAPIAVALLLGFLLASPSTAQEDPNPNSPTPVLMSTVDTTRALALSDSGRSARTRLPKAGGSVFDLNARVVLYVTNVTLMKGEDATAFRVYAIDAKRRLYRFPVLGLTPIDS